MQEVTRLDPMSVGKMYGALSLAIGIVIGVPWILLMGIVGMGFGLGGADVGRLVFMAVGMTIAYVVVGFIAGVLLAGIYNLLAGWVGGIEIELSSTHHGHQGTAPTSGASETEL